MHDVRVSATVARTASRILFGRYWLYAAMASGDGASVVSNDEMRDHHFGARRSTHESIHSFERRARASAAPRPLPSR